MSKWDVQFIFLCIFVGIAVFRVGDQFLMNNARLRGRRRRITSDGWEVLGIMAAIGFGTAGILGLIFGIIAAVEAIF
jgi:hypothetical protein